MGYKLLFFLLLFALATASGCKAEQPKEIETTKIEEGEEKKEELKIIDGYRIVDYEMLLNSNGELKDWDKIMVKGFIPDNSGVRMSFVDADIYIEYIQVEESKAVGMFFMEDEFETKTQMENYNFKRIDDLREKEGEFYLYYFGLDDYGFPHCLLDKVVIEGNTYGIEYFSPSNNSNGTIGLPGAIDQQLEYESYSNSQSITLKEVIKGENAKAVLIDHDNENERRLEDKYIVMARFEIDNYGDPLSVSPWDFKYSNETFVADFNNPVILAIENELSFTIYDMRSADGWVVFEVDENNKEGYAVYKDELWFKLY